MDKPILTDTLTWFQIAKPDPTDQDLQVQMGVHFEEVAEMIAALRGNNRLSQSMLTNALTALHGLALHMKNSNGTVFVNDDQELLDSLCDQIVTSTGTAHCADYAILGALSEVNRSNYSKFVNGKPVLNSNGKIAKGPHYSPPVLDNFL